MRASVVVSVLALSAFAQGPKVPANVKYLTASPAVNAKAKATLTKLFTGTPPALATGESQGVLMLGPFLGQRLSKLDMRGFLSITAVIPFGQTTASLKSYGARTPDEARALMGLLRDLAPVAPVKLRAMTPQEMKLIWPFVAWDLTEPLFIVAAGERKWVVSLDAAGTFPTWIEDLSSPCFTAEELAGKCLCAQVVPAGKDWKVVYAENKGCAGAAP